MKGRPPGEEQENKRAEGSGLRRSRRIIERDKGGDEDVRADPVQSDKRGKGSDVTWRFSQ